MEYLLYQLYEDSSVSGPFSWSLIDLLVDLYRLTLPTMMFLGTTLEQGRTKNGDFAAPLPLGSIFPYYQCSHVQSISSHLPSSIAPVHYQKLHWRQPSLFNFFALQNTKSTYLALSLL